MSVPTFETTDLIKGLTFAEDPRWRNGKLFFVDFYKHAVKCYDPSTGAVDVVLQLPPEKGEIASGLGWLADGTMLVVNMQGFKVMAVKPDGTLNENFADLRGVSEFWPNDMVTNSKTGVSYAGNFGFDLFSVHHDPEETAKAMRPGTIAIIHEDGRVEKGPDGLMFANGCVITPDGKHLIIAESFARRLTKFEIQADGTLTNRSVFAETGDTIPDGICLCEDGTVWVSNPAGKQLHRFAEGGKITGTIKTSQPSFAVTLGGPHMKTAYVITAPGSGNPNSVEGKIEVCETDIAGTGSP